MPGRTGRAPLPTALKVLRGNPGKRALPKDEPKPPVGKPAAPSWLSLEVRRQWDEYAPLYEAMGCLTVADVPLFAGWMEVLARMVWCQKNGEPIPGAVHKLHVHYASQFGGGPAARSKVSVKSAEPETKLGRFRG